MTKKDKKQRLVVIGNGMAGARVVEEILQRTPDKFEITLLGAEPYGNYNRILLSNVLNGTQDPTDIFLNPLAWYQDNSIRLHAGVMATKIDRDKKIVTGQALKKDACPYSNEKSSWVHSPPLSIPYDNVIIATGSRPFLPPIENYEGPGVFMFRTLDDCTRIAEYAKNCKKAAVIGGGLLGLEAARGLMTHGVQVTVLEAETQLMKAQLDHEGHRLLQSTMKTMGITTLCDKITTRIERKNGRIEKIVFKDGETLETDMVILSAGIRPLTELATASGLEVKRGIVCNDRMQTSDPSIFALGECAEHRHRLYGLVEPIWEQARVVADVMTETNIHSEYTGSSKLGTKLKVMGVELASMGITEAQGPEDEVVTYSEPHRRVYQKLILRENKLIGAILLGDIQANDTLTRIFKEEREVSENRSELLFGEPETLSLTSILEMPDSFQICNCNGVSKGQIREALRTKNCTSVAQIGQWTHAGKGCGSCKNVITQLIRAYADEITPDPSEHYYVPGIPLEKARLVSAIKEKELKSVSAVFKELAAGREHAESKAGMASLLKSIWNEQYEDERDARFINDRVHANIQNNGTFSVVPRIYGGVTSADELIRIGTIAKKYNVPMVKFTGGQRIDLLGVKKEDLPKIWKDLGLPSGHAYAKAVRTVKSCVGTDFCRYGLGNSIKLAQTLEHTYQGIESPHKIKMAVAGCPRNCSEALVKDVGVVAIEGARWAPATVPSQSSGTFEAPEARYERRDPGAPALSQSSSAIEASEMRNEARWEIYVGGAAGGTVRKGDLLCTVDNDPGEVVKRVGRFIQYYRELAQYMERSYTFVARIGIHRLKAILIDDELGLCKGLDTAIATAVKNYEDPWGEADFPKYSIQFKGPKHVEPQKKVN